MNIVTSRVAHWKNIIIMSINLWSLLGFGRSSFSCPPTNQNYIWAKNLSRTKELKWFFMDGEHHCFQICLVLLRGFHLFWSLTNNTRRQKFLVTDKCNMLLDMDIDKPIIFSLWVSSKSYHYPNQQVLVLFRSCLSYTHAEKDE